MVALFDFFLLSITAAANPVFNTKMQQPKQQKLNMFSLSQKQIWNRAELQLFD